MKTSQVTYTTGFPRLSHELAIVIYDKKLEKSLKTYKWLQNFPNRIAVSAGESLKDLDRFSFYVKKVLKLSAGQDIKSLTVIAVGGGSIGDFAGFLASVLKRGVKLIHVPSTWLAAIDSAHGGKTALNVGAYKNQIGSFYPAQKVIISKSILKTQSVAQMNSAYGELFKIGLINGGGLYKSVLKMQSLNAEKIWHLLPAAVRAKIKVVQQDPYEKKRVRYVLNLGHTFGHALELESGVSHGLAVLFGTEFALNWSRQKNILSLNDYSKASAGMMKIKKPTFNISFASLRKALGQDKKMAGKDSLYFVFVQKPGQCVVRKVSLNELITEVKRQGWF